MSKKIYHKKHMARVGDLYPEYESYNWLKGEGNLKEVYGKRNKCGVARGVFHTFINMVMDDIVDGKLFRLPAYNAMLYIEEIPEHVQDNLKEEGRLQGYEEAMAPKIYAPTYRFTTNNGDHQKFRVLFDKKRYYKMLRNIHDGKQYSSNINIW